MGLSVLTVFELLHNEYAPKHTLQGSTVLFRATGDGEGPNEPMLKLTLDPLLAWGGRIAGRLDVLDMPGGHRDMLQEPYVEDVARYLIAKLEPTLAAVP
jgi:thioesterase domain-containing protein